MAARRKKFKHITTNLEASQQCRFLLLKSWGQESESSCPGLNSMSQQGCFLWRHLECKLSHFGPFWLLVATFIP